jgi:hypothetical protein
MVAELLDRRRGIDVRFERDRVRLAVDRLRLAVERLRLEVPRPLLRELLRDVVRDRDCDPPRVDAEREPRAPVLRDRDAPLRLRAPLPERDLALRAPRVVREPERDDAVVRDPPRDRAAEELRVREVLVLRAVERDLLRVPALRVPVLLDRDAVLRDRVPALRLPLLEFRLRDAEPELRELREPALRLRDRLPAVRDFPVRREVGRELRDAAPADAPLLDARRLPWSADLAFSRPTSLLKLLFCPRAVWSCTSKARLLSSNFSNQSSHSMASSESAPLYPGKSRRIMPVSPPPPVPRTHAGCAPRSSAHCRISS